jgi:hypothetical protein
MPSGYQSFKQKTSRNVFCSSNKLKSHAEASLWVGQCLAHFGISASDTKDYNYPLDSQPEGATIWP